jgi:hypothetical protein
MSGIGRYPKMKKMPKSLHLNLHPATITCTRRINMFLVKSAKHIILCMPHTVSGCAESLQPIISDIYVGEVPVSRVDEA